MYCIMKSNSLEITTAKYNFVLSKLTTYQRTEPFPFSVINYSKIKNFNQNYILNISQIYSILNIQKTTINNDLLQYVH